MMNKNNGKESLAEKIATVLNTTPASFDPEDADLDNTRAQLLNAELYNEDTEETEVLSKFRKQNVDLLGDLYERYSGVKTSRKELFDSDEQSESEKSYGEQDNSDDEEKGSDDEGSEEDRDGEEEENGESSNSEEDEEKDDVVEDEMSEDAGDIESNDDDSTIKTFAKTDLSAQVKKGLCVRNQMNMWESLLEMRIQLQKCLVVANKMPQNEVFTEIKQTCGKEFSSQAGTTKNSVINVLDKLLLLQKLVLKKYPETKKLGNVQEKDQIDDDEEIASDTEDEKSLGSVKDEEEIEESPKKRRKLNDFAKEIDDCHSKYKNYRNDVIRKWNEKTRLTVMKNTSNSHSVLNHIEHILSDKEKLVKRTQLKRSEYDILGQESTENGERSDEQNTNVRVREEYNTEIFDDDDFYHQLLRELIEVKSADLTDPVQLSRQWIQLQNLRSKMKRKIDTRATKGRKIRYVVHSKLVNFMAPIDEGLWTEEAKNELFNSLFGKKQRVSIV